MMGWIVGGETMEDVKSELDLREAIRRIDHYDAETQRTRQLYWMEPWKVAFAGMTAGAAILTAGAVIGGLIAHWLHL